MSERPSPEAIRAHPSMQGTWYYRLELAPDVWTPGRDRPNVALTRELLEHTDVEHGGGDGAGARCLDVGIQEALVTTLLERRGASQVIGYDRIAENEDKLQLVQAALQTRFELLTGFKLAELPDALAHAGHRPFDVVAFSGVLYHMFDPLGGLAVVRGLVRDGGILVVETEVSRDDAESLSLNARERYGPYSIWLPSLSGLDYMLRFLRLQPLDCVHLVHDTGSEPNRDQRGRVAIACRAVDAPPAEPGDGFIGYSFDNDFAEFLDWKLTGSDEPPVAYDNSRETLIWRDEPHTVDVAATVDGCPIYPAWKNRERQHLRLGDVY